MTKAEAISNVESIFALYEQHGADDYIGEPVSQLEHMVQAAELARASDADDEMVLAAFFHDIGHLVEHLMPVHTMAGVGVVDHETIGAQFLQEKGFSEKICLLVKSHVQAKRFLTKTLPAYYQQLSMASKTTLSHQGGVMTDEEVTAFEADPLHPLYIKLREWDDKAKETGHPLEDLNTYKALALSHLQSQHFIIS